jgi:hypothetical protein
MKCVLEEFHRRIPNYRPIQDDPPKWVYESSRCPTYLPLELSWAR